MKTVYHWHKGTIFCQKYLFGRTIFLWNLFLSRLLRISCFYLRNQVLYCMFMANVNSDFGRVRPQPVRRLPYGTHRTINETIKNGYLHFYFILLFAVRPLTFISLTYNQILMYCYWHFVTFCFFIVPFPILK